MSFDPARLDALRQELAVERLPFRHDFWDRHLPTVDLASFRGHRHYLYQDMNPANFEQCERHLREVDDWHLLDQFSEEGAFGALLINVNGKLVSRDLLDSIEEITYLRRFLGWQREQAVKVLDIGAGYGRLAHRLCEAMPNAEVWCTDAIAESVWVCENYLAYRGVSRAYVASCVKIEAAIEDVQFDVATAIHSLSECSPEGVTWWIDLLRTHRVPYVLYVANPSYPLLDQFSAGGYELIDTRRADLDLQPFRLYRLIDA